VADQDVQGHDAGENVVAHGSFAVQEAVEFLQIDGGRLLHLELEGRHWTLGVGVGIACKRDLLRGEKGSTIRKYKAKQTKKKKKQYKRKAYIKGLCIKAKIFGREHVLAAVIDGASATQLLVAVCCDELLEDLAVGNRRDVRRHCHIVVIDGDIRQLFDFKEVGPDFERLSSLARSGALYKVGELQTGHLLLLLLFLGCVWERERDERRRVVRNKSQMR